MITWKKKNLIIFKEGACSTFWSSPWNIFGRRFHSLWIQDFSFCTVPLAVSKWGHRTSSWPHSPLFTLLFCLRSPCKSCSLDWVFFGLIDVASLFQSFCRMGQFCSAWNSLFKWTIFLFFRDQGLFWQRSMVSQARRNFFPLWSFERCIWRSVSWVWSNNRTFDKFSEYCS